MGRASSHYPESLCQPSAQKGVVFYEGVVFLYHLVVFVVSVVFVVPRIGIYSIYEGRFFSERFFADFYFGAAGFFRGFYCRILSPHALWEKVPIIILQENPRQNPPKFIQQNSPTNFCRGAGPIFKGWLFFKFSSHGSRGFCGSRGFEREKRMTPFQNIKGR